MASQATTLSAEESLHWLALHLIPGLGPRRSVPLVEKFRSPQAVFRASRSELAAMGLPSSVVSTISSGVTFEEAVQQVEEMRRHEVDLVPLLDPRYPELLRQIPDPPLVLYVKGNVELLQGPSIGVVGTRRPTPYGMAATERLAADLAGTGLVITSGMARGIDTAAHKGALSVAGKTIAVFGSGIDHIYPAENRKLSEEISRRGMLVTEFPMGTPGHPQNFPIRNRILSGLGFGVLVVEGAQYSGSAITAQMALEQGRDVFAVPGNITSKMSWAPNLLIKQGASLVQAAEDVLVQLHPDVRRKLAVLDRPSEKDITGDLRNALGPLADLGSAILGILTVESATHIDYLLERLDEWASSEVVATLFQLQMLGVVRELAGKNFVKVW